MSLTAGFETGPPGIGFAAMLRGYRRAAGLTQSELAERASVGVRTVRDLESGRAKRPQRGTVGLLADALGLSGGARTRFEAAARLGSGVALDPAALPPPPDIVGRDADIDVLVRLVAQTQAVVLLGLAGVGKTCLATAVAHHAAGSFPGGVAGISITDVSAPDDILAAVAAGFGVAGAEDLPERTAAPALLVVDGVDQQPEAVLAALRWLRTYATGLHLLATSRQPVDLAGAVSWPVAPLDTAAAAELFARRLRQVRAEPVGPTEAPAIAELLRRVGGLPLAVELAAARGRVLTVSQLLTRYRDRVLDLGPPPPAEAGAHGSSATPETLRDAVAASYRLLHATDQRALRQLAAVRGRWSVELAERLLDRSGADVEALLERLVGLGLVVVRGTGEWRFRLLAVVREYAIERSEASGEIAAVRDRHAAVIADAAAVQAPRVAGAAMLTAVSTLDLLTADVRAALGHALDTQPLIALRLAVATARWCRFRGRAVEARVLLRRLMADPRLCRDSLDPGLYADALCALGVLAISYGEPPAELPSLGVALDIYRGRDDVRGELWARVLLGRVHLIVGNLSAAREQAELALAGARGADRARDIAVAGRLAASVDVGQGDLDGAHRRLGTVTRLAVGLGDERLVALATAQLAEVARLGGRPGDAVELSRRAAARLGRYGDPDQRARALTTVVAGLAESGLPAEAAPVLADISYPGLHQLASAYVARATGDFATAAKLYASAAETLRGRRDVREVVDALVGAVACSTDEVQLAGYRAQLSAVLAAGAALLPRDQLVVSGWRP